MKRTLYAALLLIILNVNVYAEGWSAGAKIWYGWYEPSFRYELMGRNDDTSTNNKFTTIEETTFSYGGMLSYRTSGNWALSAVMGYGRGYEFKGEYDFVYAGNSFHMTKKCDSFSKLDTDLNASYPINNYLNFFTGLKYSYIIADGSYNSYLIADPANSLYWRSGDFTSTLHQVGPGLGLGSTVNLFSNLYFLSTISGLYQFEHKSLETTGASNKTDKSTNNSFGVNATATLAYLFADSNITLSLGGRYQRFWAPDADRTDTVYGTVLSVIYSF